MKIPSKFAIFMKNKENKTPFLNLIGKYLQKIIKNRMEKLFTFPTNVTAERLHDYILKESQYDAQYCNELSSNHKDSDMNLVAIFQSYESTVNEKLLARNPSGDIEQQIKQQILAVLCYQKFWKGKKKIGKGK